MANRADFEVAFELIIGHEGGFTENPADPGNWTGGASGKGVCLGTKYGISAAAYPSTDIRGLQLEDAHRIYERDYWGRAGCPECPGSLAFLLFDAAVNTGVHRAVRWLQETLEVTADGQFGPRTKAALEKALEARGLIDVAGELHGRRIHFMAGLSTWSQFGRGWSRRLARIPLEAMAFWEVAADDVLEGPGMPDGLPPDESVGVPDV